MNGLLHGRRSFEVEGLGFSTSEFWAPGSLWRKAEATVVLGVWGVLGDLGV